MLSSIGRTTIQRLALRPVATSSHYAVVSRLATRASSQQPSLAWLGLGSRSVVTVSVTKPKKSTAATKKTATTTSKAKTATKTKRAAPAKKKKKLVKKKAVKAARRPKKELTPEQKDAVQLRTLKKKALFNEPKPLPESPWTIYIMENRKGISCTPAESRQLIAELATHYRTLPSSETSRLQNTVAQNKIANAAAYKAWIETHTAEEISEATNARNILARKFNFPKNAKKTIKDDRQPKRITHAYSQFTKARWGSGEYANTPVPAASKSIATEWKNLSEAEKEPYINLAKLDRDRYDREVQSTFNRTTKNASP